MIPKILVLPASARVGSANRRLAAEATRLLALTEAEVTLLNLGDYPLPLFDPDPDGEEAFPDHALGLAERVAAQDGLVIVSRASHAAPPPLLLNALDWIGAVRRLNGRPVQPFRRLIVGLAAVSNDPHGGTLWPLRLTMTARGAEVVAGECLLREERHAFDEDGRLADEAARLALEDLVQSLLDHAKALGRHG